jgi:hypothetical protein
MPIDEFVMQMNIQLVERRIENSQFVRKAAFVALSRIGRRYPQFQDQLIPVFFRFANEPHAKDSILWGALIGLGRMSQSNALLRSQVVPLLMQACSSPSTRVRWAGIRGLGHASCPIGNVVNDEAVEELCFEQCKRLLKNGGAPDLAGKPELSPFVTIVNNRLLDFPKIIHCEIHYLLNWINKRGLEEGGSVFGSIRDDTSTWSVTPFKSR